MTRETCNTTLSWTCDALLYILVVAITLSDVSFGLRVYAMWSRYKAVLVICCCVATIGMPLAIISGGCNTSASSVVFAIFVVIIIAEAVTTVLAFYRAFSHFRYTSNALVQSIMRDGAFYFVTMFSMSVANVLVIFLVALRLSAFLFFYGLTYIASSNMLTWLLCKFTTFVNWRIRTVNQSYPAHMFTPR
ncbi:hypothetical protein BDN67DRAFT_981872 [Paxillus ammoniavirescens]|nr:hypothetical protein BDN67DRAFT_981872 [Paxillus ammoniavirescens]